MRLLNIYNRDFFLNYTYLKYKFYCGFFIFKLNNYDSNYIYNLSINFVNLNSNFNFFKKNIIKKFSIKLENFYNSKGIYIIIFYNNLKQIIENFFLKSNNNNFIINYFIFNKFSFNFEKIKIFNMVLEKNKILFEIFQILNIFILKLINFYSKINF